MSVETFKGKVISTLKQIATMNVAALKEDKMAIPLVVGVFIIFYILYNASATPATSAAAKKSSATPKKKKSSSSNKKGSSSPKIKTPTKKSNYKTTSAVLNAAAKQMDVKIVEVTSKTASAIHKALRSKGALTKLTSGRLRSTFVYDFLSCVAGTYLQGSSKIDGKIPADDEYDINNGGANFAWQGLRIFVLRQKSDIKGMVVLHDAYLSSYPGPDASHHRYDPQVKLSSNGKNIAKQIGNVGSKKWTDIPIVCGSGYGRLCLAVGLNAAKASSTNFLVNIAGGSSNRKMVKLLESFEFMPLYMRHPKTGKDWLDEEGVELELMYRDQRLSVADVDALLLTGSGPSIRASSKKVRAKTPAKKASTPKKLKKKATPATKKSGKKATPSSKKKKRATSKRSSSRR